MMNDPELLADYLERVADRFTPAELVERLEDAGIITIWDLLDNLADFIVRGREVLEI